MANCSIPNSIPAIGRTSTPSSRRSRKQSSTAARCEPFTLTAIIESWIPALFNAQRLTLNTEHSTRAIGCWALGVGRWAFSASWRVKGAWWPSRSSKPLSVSYTRDRGRFDSYPLRFLIFDFDFQFAIWRVGQRPAVKLRPTKGGGR
jgi:hypothetical protein